MAPYYRVLARKIALTIIVVAFLPYAFTFFIFYSSYNDSLHSQVIAAVTGVVEEHQRTIDEYLAQRLGDLKNAANLVTVSGLAKPAQVRRTLDSLRAVYGAFADLGLINDQGRHEAYAGPYELEDADYAQSPWFKEVMAKGAHVSDVFLGYRGVPHFVAAVKVAGQDGRQYVLRATIDSASFSSLVEVVRLGRSGEAFIVNRQGLYQTHTRAGGQLLSPSDLDLPGAFSGVAVLDGVGRQGREVVLAATWLKGGDWLLVCHQDMAEAFGPLFQARKLAVLITLVAFLLLVATTAVLTRQLVARMAATDREKELLNEQIIQSGKLASLGELAAGVAHEINNPVAIMVEEAGWLLDLMHEEEALFAQSPHRKEYLRALNQIDTQGRRCKEITTKLLGFARRSDAPAQPTQINDVAAEVAGLVERPARYLNVVLTLDLGADLPLVSASPSELQQVLMNLVNNAVDAMEKTGGVVVVSTHRSAEGGVEIKVSDNGPGIPEALLSRIFDPFFTTKPVGKGTGLGLSICYGIVQKLGGRIEAQSHPGQGTVFLVRLPAAKRQA
jgi:two-component system NtrC family sensor kinase